MEKIFSQIMSTDEGKQAVFDVLSTAMFFRNTYLKPKNPLVEGMAQESIQTERARKIFLQNVKQFEDLVLKLYTFEDNESTPSNDLTSESK